MSYPDIRRVSVDYDTSRYGEWISLPLEPPHGWPFEDPATWTEVNISTPSIDETLQSLPIINSDTINSHGGQYPPSLDLTRLLPKQDVTMLKTTNLVIQALDDGTDNPGFNQNFSWIMPQTGVIDQVILSFAIGFDVSNYVGGSYKLNNVNFIGQSYISKNQPNPLGGVSAVLEPDDSFPFTALQANGTQVLIVKTSIDNINVPIIAGQYFAINLQTNYDYTPAMEDAATVFQGLIPLFPYISADVYKPFYRSEIILHIQGSPDSVDKIAAVSQTKFGGING